MRTLHPSVAAFDLMWKRGQNISTNLFGYDTSGAMAWNQSPFFSMIKHRQPTMRRRLDDPGMATSWATDRADGFGDQHIEILERLLPRLTLSLDIGLARQIAVNVLDTYVGPASGKRILAGDIRPGKKEALPAVTFYADLRGFTTVSDTMPRDRIGDMLNSYFECMVRPVLDRGGQVLKFLGDGLLAAFDTLADETDPL